MDDPVHGTREPGGRLARAPRTDGPGGHAEGGPVPAPGGAPGPFPAPFAERLDPRDGLIALTVEHRRPISAFDPETESLRGSARPDVLLCGPICEEEMVEALVVVHEMPLLELTPASCARFDALLN